MSRIGRAPIAVPAGVDVKIDGQTVTVKGPKGTLTRTVNDNITVTLDNGVITVTRPNDLKENRSLHGLNRTLIANMVKGVSEGFTKELEINGIGYRAAKQGKDLVLNIGYSHNVVMTEIEGISIEVPSPNKIIIPVPISKRLVSLLPKLEVRDLLNLTRVKASSTLMKLSVVRKVKPVRAVNNP